MTRSLRSFLRILDRPFPADVTLMYCANVGPTLSQLCQGPWAMAELTRTLPLHMTLRRDLQETDEPSQVFLLFFKRRK